jgi:hypothetical protein
MLGSPKTLKQYLNETDICNMYDDTFLWSVYRMPNRFYKCAFFPIAVHTVVPNILEQNVVI